MNFEILSKFYPMIEWEKSCEDSGDCASCSVNPYKDAFGHCLVLWNKQRREPLFCLFEYVLKMIEATNLKD